LNAAAAATDDDDDDDDVKPIILAAFYFDASVYSTGLVPLIFWRFLSSIFKTAVAQKMCGGFC